MQKSTTIPDIASNTLRKLERLKNLLNKMPGAVVAFSGGVDSTLLLKVAADVLKTQVIAVTASSDLYPDSELKTAKKIARLLKVKHLVIKSCELKNPLFPIYPPSRCYYCKTELFQSLKKIADRRGYVVLEASNYSDLNDVRPGIVAARKLGVVSPLIQVRLTKDEIRKLAKKFKLPNWNKPSMACLASRIPYGLRIDRKTLRRIDRAEHFLRKLGFSQVRVRDHFPVARIEILQNDFESLLRHRKKVTIYFKKLGYKYITLDLEGYRTGSMNL